MRHAENVDGIDPSSPPKCRISRTVSSHAVRLWQPSSTPATLSRPSRLKQIFFILYKDLMHINNLTAAKNELQNYTAQKKHDGPRASYCNTRQYCKWSGEKVNRFETDLNAISSTGPQSPRGSELFLEELYLSVKGSELSNCTTGRGNLNPFPRTASHKACREHWLFKPRSHLHNILIKRRQAPHQIFITALVSISKVVLVEGLQLEINPWRVLH